MSSKSEMNKNSLAHSIRQESLSLAPDIYSKFLNEFNIQSYSIMILSYLPTEKLQRLLETIRKETR